MKRQEILERRQQRLLAKKNELLKRSKESEDVAEVRAINEKLQDIADQLQDVQDELQAIKITLTMAPPALAMLAKMTGKSFDKETGMFVDSERNNDYYAMMYRTKGTDGAYRYVSRLKGTFNIPDENNQTENDGTDTTNTTIEYTGIYTEHEFTKGKFDGTNWIKASAKGVVVDTRYGLADVSKFFEKVQTPDTVKVKAEG